MQHKHDNIENQINEDTVNLYYNPNTISFICIRHGETPANSQNLAQGSSNDPYLNGLNEKGVHEVALSANIINHELSGVNPENIWIYSPQLYRTIDTALIVAEEIKLMDNRFHETLYLISGSTTFYNILLSLHKKVQKYRKASIQSKLRAAESVEEHKQIFEAIVNRDAKKAEELATSHVKNAYKNIIGEN
jgi:bisphosphoglycerate-dependent phosphoglycerate mutase